MYSLEIELSVHATDSNKILGVNKFEKHKIFEAVKKEVSFRVSGKQPEKPLSKFRLSFTRFSPRTLDWDNFVSSLKPTIDGLRISGVIEDDSWGFIKGAELNQEIAKNKKLVVRVEEVE